MTRTLQIWWGAMLGFGVGLSAGAQAQQYASWSVYKAADGLNESFTTAVSVSPQGHVWARHGEFKAISRLDGFEIQQIPTLGDDNYPVLESADGRVWSLYDQGLQEFRKTKWIRFPIAEIQAEIQTNVARRFRPIPIQPLNHDRVLYLLADRLMEFNKVTRKTLLRRRASETSLVRFLDLAPARDQGLWISGSHGLVRFNDSPSDWKDPQAWQEFLIPPELAVQDLQRPVEDDQGGVTCVAESSTRNARMLVYFNRHTWRTYEFLSGKIRQGWQGAEGDFWGYSINTLARLNTEGNTLPEEVGPLGGQFFDVGVEPKGVFWLATSEGLARHAPLPWRSPSSVIPPNVRVHGILEDHQGALWFAGSTSLFLFQNGQWRTFGYPESWDLSFVPTDGLFGLADNRLVLAAGDRFLLFDPASHQFQLGRHPQGHRVRILGQLPDGSLCAQLMASQTNWHTIRFERFDGKEFHPLFEPEANWNLDRELHFCKATANGDLWFGGKGGVALWRDNQCRLFNRSDGEPPEQAFCFLELDDHRIWCGGLGRIHEFNGKNWTVVRHGFDRVNALIKARDGTIWAGSSDGVFRLVDHSWIVNDIAEGLPSAAVYEILEDRRGNLWAGTARGLGLYDPSADIDPPRVSILSANGQEEFPPDTPITLILRGQDKWKYTSPERLLFSYRLDNLNWSPFTSETTVTFKEVTSGKHYFRARAMDRSANVDRAPAEIFEFTVVLPWYLETRLILSSFCGFVLVLFFAALAINRHQQLKRSYAEVGRMVAQRTRELELANEALLHSQKMEALGTLAAGIAHDFNNILSIIKGSAQIIEHNLANADKIRIRVQRIKTVVDQGAGIVKTMLGFSQASNKQRTLEDANTIVKETLKLSGDRLLPQVTLRAELAPHLPPIMCSKDLLQQMLLNLILNAADAMTGKGQVWLLTSQTALLPDKCVLLPEPASSYVVIKVKDTGSGIAPEIMPRIFEPFFSTKSLSTRRGTGLGLSMVYEFAKEQGCGLQVESTAGQGSTFAMLLPVRPPATEPPT